MPRPIETFERFIRAVEVTVERGIVYGLVETPATQQMPNPYDLRRYGSIYWRLPSSAYMPPVCAIYAKFYRTGKEPLAYEEMAVNLMGIPTDLAQAIHRITYPYDGYSKSMRRELLVACGLW